MLLGEYTFRITSGYLDQYKRIRPYAIFDIAQEAASTHAEEIGIGYQKMLEKHLIWIVVRNKYVMVKDIHDTTFLHIKTWPQPHGRFESIRDFLIFDDKGNLCVKGSTLWCLYNVDSHHIARMENAEVHGNFCLDKNFAEPFNKIAIGDEKQYQYCFEYQVNLTDLDWNHHMNNARYAELVYNAMAGNENTKIHSVEINYLKQAKLGDLIIVKKNVETQGSMKIIGYIGEDICFVASGMLQ